MLKFAFEELIESIIPGSFNKMTRQIVELSLLTNRPVLIDVDGYVIAIRHINNNNNNEHNSQLMFKDMDGNISTISAKQRNYVGNEMMRDIFMYCDAIKDGYLFRHHAFGEIHANGYVTPPRLWSQQVIDMLFDSKCERMLRNVINACDISTTFVEYLLDEMIDKNNFDLLQYMTYDTKNFLLTEFTEYTECYRYIPYLIKYCPHTGPNLEL